MRRPQDWQRAVASLRERRPLLKAIRDAVPPTSVAIQNRARAAGL